MTDHVATRPTLPTSRKTRPGTIVRRGARQRLSRWLRRRGEVIGPSASSPTALASGVPHLPQKAWSGGIVPSHAGHLLATAMAVEDFCAEALSASDVGAARAISSPGAVASVLMIENPCLVKALLSTPISGSLGYPGAARSR